METRQEADHGFNFDVMSVYSKSVPRVFSLETVMQNFS